MGSNRYPRGAGAAPDVFSPTGSSAMMSAGAVAAYLGVSLGMVYRLGSSGEIPSIRVTGRGTVRNGQQGGHRRYLRRDVEAYRIKAGLGPTEAVQAGLPSRSPLGLVCVESMALCHALEAAGDSVGAFEVVPNYTLLGARVLQTTPSWALLDAGLAGVRQASGAADFLASQGCRSVGYLAYADSAPDCVFGVRFECPTVGLVEQVIARVIEPSRPGVLGGGTTAGET